MSNPLGNPEIQTPLTITDTVQEVTITQGLISLEVQNTGNSDIYYGNSADLTSSNGLIIYSQGEKKSWENVPSNFKISFMCATGQTSTLRLIYYQ